MKGKQDFVLERVVCMDNVYVLNEVVQIKER